jgi:hypothetical protein
LDKSVIFPTPRAGDTDLMKLTRDRLDSSCLRWGQRALSQELMPNGCYVVKFESYFIVAGAQAIHIR